MKNHPEIFFNIDETGVSTEHSPPKIVCAKDSSAQSVTSPRTYNVTLIRGGNALGNHVPPYYVFPGKRWNSEFLESAAPGSDGEMSPTGWSNSDVFNNYLTKHFAKYVGITNKQGDQKTLVLYDGHKSHAQLTLTDWAKRHNVILFVLPPHSSHLTQPLDVGVFGPFKCMYNHECELYKKINPGISITKYAIAKLTAKPYVKAFSPENLSSAFKKAGIYPFNSAVITPEQVAPSLIYREENVEQEQATESDADSDSTINYSTIADSQPIIPENDLQPCQQRNISSAPVQEISENFFSARNITVVKQRPKRKFIPPFIAGSLLKKNNQDILNTISKKSKTTKTVSEKSKSKSVKINTSSKKPSNVNVVKKVSKVSSKKSVEPVPSTSGTSMRKGAPLDLSSEDSYEGDSDVFNEDDELCCVCNKWEPKKLQQCAAFVIAKWAKCDYCPHWTHLIYCSKVKFVRFKEEFRCTHCLTKP